MTRTWPRVRWVAQERGSSDLLHALACPAAPRGGIEAGRQSAPLSASSSLQIIHLKPLPPGLLLRHGHDFGVDVGHGMLHAGDGKLSVICVIPAIW